MIKKTLPSITWQNIAPPYYNYEYFQHGDSFPFRPEAEVFDVVNAWWLIEAATLVYAEEEFVRPRFQQAGLPDVRYFDGDSTDCFVAHNDTYIFLVFRGTESRRRSGSQDVRHILADVKADCNVLLVDAEHSGKVHKGFNTALDEVWDELLAYLRQIHQPPRTLWMTGHSLGAALATLAADRYGDVQGLYTFGSPRVGDSEFRKQFSVRAYRIVNGADIVTSVPPPGLYAHVGEHWYLDSEGLLRKNMRRSEILTDGFRGEMHNILDSIDQAKRGSFSFIPGGLKDHIPTCYAVHLWNNLLTMEAAH